MDKSLIKSQTPVSIELSDDLTFDQWIDVLRELPRTKFADINLGKSARNFYLGDVILYGERRWPDKAYESAVQAGGLLRDTLWHYAWTCRSFPPDRRVEGLSPAHHEVVGRMLPGDQKRWLDIAKSENLSVQQFRAVVRKEKKDITLSELEDPFEVSPDSDTLVADVKGERDHIRIQHLLLKLGGS